MEANNSSGSNCVESDDRELNSDHMPGSSNDCEQDHENKEKLRNQRVEDKERKEKELEARKTREVDLTPEKKEELKEIAENLKKDGNQDFGHGRFEEAEQKYTQALETSPLEFVELRAIYFSNRAAARIKLEKWKDAVEDCTEAIETGHANEKPLERRAHAYSQMDDTLEQSIEDYKKLLEKKPNHRPFVEAISKCEARIAERNEKLKTEMMDTLKKLGNLVLNPFGLSTNNFEMVQQPGGGYSINMKK
uniref:Tetratricopeptide repeat protein 1 n=1 Tax=Acrobeloides nanus TaxID=290746 RepID=A0A914BWU8_9BILA